MEHSLDSLNEQLEAKKSNLRDALHYWKTWEAEYEGLLEELDEQKEPSAQEMVDLGIQYGGGVINESGRYAIRILRI